MTDLSPVQLRYTPLIESELIGRGDYEQAVLALEQRILRDGTGTGVDYYLMLLSALTNARRPQEALKWADLAIKKFSLNESLYYWKSVLLQEIGSDEDSLLPLQQAIFIDPDFVMGHFTMFMVLRRLRRLEQAEVSRRNAERIMERLSPNEILPHSEELTVKQVSGMLNELGRYV